MSHMAKDLIPVPLNSETSNLEFAETTSVTLEWRISGLKQVFDGTKGDAKSKCIKSAIFGDADALWECIWYPNAGAPPGQAQPPPSAQSLPGAGGGNNNNNLGGPGGPGGAGLGAGGAGGGGATVGNTLTSSNGGEFSSFYLSAVPTQEEKDAGLKGRWSRRGLYAFRFEIKTHNKGTTLATKEAYNHIFSSKTVNWGWQSFGRRDNIFYNAPPVVRGSDSFIVICTVSAGATPPAAAWLNLPPPTTPKQIDLGVSPTAFAAAGCGWKGSAGALRGLGGGNGAMGGERQLVPKDLIQAVGWLFDDELYSDVEFVIPVRKKHKEQVKARPPTITERDTMADEEVYEMGGISMATTTDAAGGGGIFPAATTNAPASSSKRPPTFTVGSPPETDPAEVSSGARTILAGGGRGERPRYKRIWANKRILKRCDYFDTMLGGGFAEGHSTSSASADEDIEMTGDHSALDDSLDSSFEDSDLEEEALSDNESDGVRDDEGELSEDELMITPGRRKPTGLGPSTTRSSTRIRLGPQKTKLVIRDSAYRTWQALLYWLYTDVITFAPLASSFIGGSGSTKGGGKGSSASISTAGAIGATALALGDAPIRARREWCDQWASERATVEGANRRPKPCSAKAIYRLADKFNLEPLKQRAYAHIIANLSVQNIPYEAFSAFSATYEQVRKVQVSYFLDHWSEIKSSPAMVNIWQAIRLGRHQGFEEVWPHIVSNLEFKSTDRDERGAGPGSSRDDY